MHDKDLTNAVMHDNANKCAYLLSIGRTLSPYHIILAAKEAKLKAFKTLLTATPNNDFREILHLVILHYGALFNNAQRKKDVVIQFHDVILLLIPYLDAIHLGHQYQLLLGDFFAITRVLPAMLRLPNISAAVVFGIQDGKPNSASNSIFKSYVKHNNYRGIIEILNCFEGNIPDLDLFLRDIDLGPNKAFLSRSLTSLLLHHSRNDNLRELCLGNSNIIRVRFRTQYCFEVLSGEQQTAELNHITNYIDKNYSDFGKKAFIKSCETFFEYYNNRRFSKYIEPYILRCKPDELEQMHKYKITVFLLLSCVLPKNISAIILSYVNGYEIKFCNIKIIDGKLDLLEDKRGLALLEQWVKKSGDQVGTPII